MGPLEKWLLKNAAKVDLQVRIFDNHILASLGIFDIEAEIQIAGKKYLGRGTSFHKDLALKKACSEVIERFFLHKNKFPTSNGMAAHINEALAIEVATLELIERDLFLCRYLSQTPFSKIQISNSLFESVRVSLNRNCIDLSFYSMGTLNSVQSILCAIDGLKCSEPYGYILGSASGDLNSAIESSFLEAYRNFAHYKKGQSITLAAFLDKSSKARIDFTDHGNLALDLQYAETLKNDFFGSTDTLEVNESINLNLDCEILSLAETPFEDAPMSVVRVSSPKLQSLFVGNTTNKSLNVNRLESFCEAYNRPYRLYELPHPFN